MERLLDDAEIDALAALVSDRGPAVPLMALVTQAKAAGRLQRYAEELEAEIARLEKLAWGHVD